MWSTKEDRDQAERRHRESYAPDWPQVKEVSDRLAEAIEAEPEDDDFHVNWDAELLVDPELVERLAAELGPLDGGSPEPIIEYVTVRQDDLKLALNLLALTVAGDVDPVEDEALSRLADLAFPQSSVLDFLNELFEDAIVVIIG